MLTIVSAGVLERGDRILREDGNVWVVDALERLDGLVIAYLTMLGLVTLEEWAAGLPGRVDVAMLLPRDAVTVLG